MSEQLGMTMTHQEEEDMMNELREHMEGIDNEESVSVSLEALLVSIQDTGVICRRQMVTLESIDPEAFDKDELPLETFTETPTQTNFDIGMESIISAVGKSIKELAIRVWKALVAAFRWIGQLLGIVKKRKQMSAVKRGQVEQFDKLNERLNMIVKRDKEKSNAVQAELKEAESKLDREFSELSSVNNELFHAFVNKDTVYPVIAEVYPQFYKYVERSELRAFHMSYAAYLKKPNDKGVFEMRRADIVSGQVYAVSVKFNTLMNNSRIKPDIKGEDNLNILQAQALLNFEKLVKGLAQTPSKSKITVRDASSPLFTEYTKLDKYTEAIMKKYDDFKYYLDKNEREWGTLEKQDQITFNLSQLKEPFSAKHTDLARKLFAIVRYESRAILAFINAVRIVDGLVAHVYDVRLKLAKIANALLMKAAYELDPDRVDAMRKEAEKLYEKLNQRDFDFNKQ